MITYPERRGTPADAPVQSVNGKTGTVVLAPGDLGFSTATTLATTPPTSGDPKTATSDKFFGRWVFGSITLVATVANAASYAIAVETAVGSGSYTTIMTPRLDAGGVVSTTIPYSFFCPAGRRYKFTAGGLAGVTETHATYSYTEI